MVVELDKLWVTRSEALTLTGMGDKAFRRNIQPTLKADDVRKTTGRGQAYEFSASAIVKRLIEITEETVDVDPLLVGSESPALERFRAARADREELELAVRREQLIDLEDFLVWFDAEVAAPIRKNLDKLQRKHGSAAVDVVASGLHTAQGAISQRFQK